MNTNTPGSWLPRLEAWLAKNRPTFVAQLHPGADAAAVADLPPELAALYRWRDGQSHSGYSLLESHWFMPLDQVARQRRDIAKDRDEMKESQDWWGDDWYPFLDDGQGNLTCVVKGSGRVILYLNDTEERNDLAPSLDVLFSALVDSLEAGYWRVEGDAVVAADEDALNALFKERQVCFDAYGY